MKKLLILFLLLLTSAAFAAKPSAYTGTNYNVPTKRDIATATGIPKRHVIVKRDDSTQTIAVLLRKGTAEDQAELDTLMVTTHGLTKQ